MNLFMAFGILLATTIGVLLLAYSLVFVVVETRLMEWLIEWLLQRKWYFVLLLSILAAILIILGYITEV